MARHGLRIKRINRTTVLINNEVIKLREIRGIRPKCFYGDYVIKFDDDEDINSADQEVYVWRRLAHRHRKHFAKLVGWNVEQGYVIQERIKFRRGRRSLHAMQIVDRMINRYGLEDISTYGANSNWGVSECGAIKIYDWAAGY